MRISIIVAATTLAIAMIATAQFGAIIGSSIYALMVLITLAWWERYDRKRSERPPVRDFAAERLAIRINTTLTKTLGTAEFTIRSLSEWPATQMAEWPEIPEMPTPLMAWDVVVQVNDGSRGCEQLTIYVDASMYVLPAVGLDECELIQELGQE